MKRIEKAKRIGTILDRLFPQPDIPLTHQDPYTLLVSVVLSAQTTDRKVNQVVPSLFKLAATPAQMIRLDHKAILKIIKPIGLAPTKAKNILALSRKLVHDFSGQVPANFDDLESLPGVGHKTASVVMAQAFSIPAFPVDTHIHRLAKRWGLSRGHNVKQTETDLKRVFAQQVWNRRHLQIIYFGRQYCPARAHDLAGCPICSWAASQRQKNLEANSAVSKRSQRGSLASD